MTKLEGIEDRLKILQNETSVSVAEPNVLGLIGITLIMLIGFAIILTVVEVIRERKLRSSNYKRIKKFGQSLKNAF